MAQPQPIAGNQDFTSVVDMAAQLPTLNVADLTASSEVVNDIAGDDLTIVGTAVNTANGVSITALQGNVAISAPTPTLGDISLSTVGAGAGGNIDVVADGSLSLSTSNPLGGNIALRADGNLSLDLPTTSLLSFFGVAGSAQGSAGIEGAGLPAAFITYLQNLGLLS